MKNKLIIVDGPCTAGKLSISKHAFKQIKRQEEIIGYMKSALSLQSETVNLMWRLTNRRKDGS